MGSDNVISISLNDCDCNLYFNRNDQKPYKITLIGNFEIEKFEYDGRVEPLVYTTAEEFLKDLREGKLNGKNG